MALVVTKKILSKYFKDSLSYRFTLKFCDIYSALEERSIFIYYQSLIFSVYCTIKDVIYKAYNSSYLVNTLKRHCPEDILSESKIFRYCYSLILHLIEFSKKCWQNSYLNNLAIKIEKEGRPNFTNNLGLIIIVAVITNTILYLCKRLPFLGVSIYLRILMLSIGVILVIVDSTKWEVILKKSCFLRLLKWFL
ncbi:MAG: hypothetical protein V1872_09100 [bacterium]